MKLATKICSMYENEDPDMDTPNVEDQPGQHRWMSIMQVITDRLTRKPVHEKARILDALLEEVLREMSDMPQGEMKLLKLLKAFKKENF